MADFLKSGRRASLVLALMGVMASPALAQDEAAGVSDPIAELLTFQFPGSEVDKEQRKNYDEAVFLLAKYENKPDTANVIRAEGRKVYIDYRVPVETTPLEVARAYQRTLEAEGYEQLFSCSKDECGSLWRFTGDMGVGGMVDNRKVQRYATYEKVADGQRTVVSIASSTIDWIKDKSHTQIRLVAINSEAEIRELEQLTAEGIAAEMAERGSAAIYGLTFATDSATLEDGSKATLDVMATFLRENPQASIALVGHTDDQGALDYNRDLSTRRANAVKEALVTDYAIGTERLDAYGVGYLAPVAPNADDDGRSKNRRVEMVLLRPTS